MSEQFKFSESYLPLFQLDQLIQFQAFLKSGQISSKINLNLHDHLTNLRFLSQTYIQRQRQGNKKNQIEEEDIEKQQPIIMKKSRAKVQMITLPNKYLTSNIKSSKDAQIRKQETHSCKDVNLTEIQFVTDKKQFSKKTSKKKVESVPQKKVKVVQPQSFPQKKVVQPQRIAIFSPKLYATPILDTSYIRDASNKKIEKQKSTQERSSYLSQLNKSPKNEKNNQQKIEEKEKFNHKSVKQQLSDNFVKQYGSDNAGVNNKSYKSISKQKPKNNKQYIIQKRDNFKEQQRSRSKSITKAKIPKESNIFGKIKIVDKVYQKQPVTNEIVVNQFQPAIGTNPKIHRAQGNKKSKQNTLPTKMKNIKIDNRKPIQIMPSQQSEASFIYEYKKHQENQDPYNEPSQDDASNIKPITVEIRVEKQLTTKQKQFPFSPVNKEKQKEMINQNIPSMLKKQGQPQAQNNELKKVEKANFSIQSGQSEQKSFQSSRRKIFQPLSAPIKDDQKVKSSQQDKLTLNNLTEEEIKMMLSVKGNKYKETMMIELIKQNRRANKK